MQVNINVESSYQQSANRRPQAAQSAVNREEPIQGNDDIGAHCRRWDNERGQWVKTRPMKLTELIQQTTPRNPCHQSPGIGHPRWNSSTRIDENLYKTIPKYEVEFQKKFQARKLAASTPVPNKGRVQPFTPDSSAVEEATTRKWSEPPSFQNEAVPGAAPADTSKLEQPAGNQQVQPVENQQVQTVENHQVQTVENHQVQSVAGEVADKPNNQIAQPVDSDQTRPRPTVTITLEKPITNEVGKSTDQMNVTVKVNFEVPMDAPPGYKQTITRRV